MDLMKLRERGVNVDPMDRRAKEESRARRLEVSQGIDSRVGLETRKPKADLCSWMGSLKGGAGELKGASGGRTEELRTEEEGLRGWAGPAVMKET